MHSPSLLCGAAYFGINWLCGRVFAGYQRISRFSAQMNFKLSKIERSIRLKNMRLVQFLERWLDVRPNEVKRFLLLTTGAFLLLGFVVLCRSLRESLFLGSFDVKMLPYLKAGQAVLVLPAVGIFTRLVGRGGPRRTVKALAAILACAVALLWPVALRNDAGVIAFFLVAAVGALVLASGFWVVAAECFAVRGAKRLFGVIIAGGTAGGMTMGLSARWLVAHVGEALWGTILVLPLLALLLVISLVPPGPWSASAHDKESGGVDSSTDNILRAIWRSHYLRTLALILLAATAASAIVDFQFLKYVGGMGGEESRAAFLGSFYGWTGGLSLLIQVLVASRVMSSAGVAAGLGVLPVFLLLGSSAIVAVPGLLAATLLRGGDYSLRKSLLRPAVEFLYVPLPDALRRRTKSFIDVSIDSSGEVAGSAMIVAMITLGGLPVRYLAIPVAGLAVCLLVASKQMGRLYVDEIVNRLSDGGTEEDEDSPGRILRETRILTASFSRMYIQNLLGRGAGMEVRDPELSGTAINLPISRSSELGPLAAMRSADNEAALAALENVESWTDDHVQALARLLVRNEIRETVENKLVEIGECAVPVLAAVLADEGADFVLRRRIPRVLVGIGGDRATEALLRTLSCGRFEVRYRATVALVRLKKRGALAMAERSRKIIWSAVRKEVESNRPIWEMQRLLDGIGRDEEDELVTRRVGVRGELSLEHTFRMLTLVLDPEPVSAAFHGIILDDEGLKSFALEYLEQVLPAKIRERLWLFIGDISEYRRAGELRPISRVVSDLMSSRATLFGGAAERDALRKLLEGGSGK